MSDYSKLKKLLHYENNSKNIISADFYLSKTKRIEDEILELKKQYFTPITNENHPRCRFPARYLWLSQNFDLPYFVPIPKECKKLKDWCSKEINKSINLVLVSGYLGNPASTFGHALIKIESSKKSLFDTTINYGALIPANENTFKYVIKGLFGGYLAGYSDQYFFTQDVVYSNREFRDMWKYELDLTYKEKKFLLFHIWEIIGKKKKYYFLTKNCAYELGKVLEVVLVDNITSNSNLWFTPIELFNNLKKTGKVKKIEYIPSAQRVLYVNYKNLNIKLKKLARKFINSPETRLESILEGLDDQEKIQLLNFLLVYQNYTYIKELPSPSKKTIDLKYKILLKRMGLPISNSTKKPNIPKLIPPTEGLKPFNIALGYGYNPTKKSYINSGFTVYSMESIGQNSLEGNELIVFDVLFGVKDNIFLDKIDYIKIKEFKNNSLKNSLSWNLQITTHKETNSNKYDNYFMFGVGKSKNIKNFKSYLFADFSLHSSKSNIRIYPKIGIFGPLNTDLKFLTEVGFEIFEETKKFKSKISIEFLYAISSKYSLKSKITFTKKPKALILLRTHF